MHIEEKYAIGLGVLSLVLLGIGWLLATRLSTAPARTVRVVVPAAAVLTLLAYGLFVVIARTHVKG